MNVNTLSAPNDVPTETFPQAVGLIAVLLLGLPIFFTGYWVNGLIGLIGLLVATSLGLWLSRPYRLIAWPWLLGLFLLLAELVVVSEIVSRLRLMVLPAWLPWLFGGLILIMAGSWAYLQGMIRSATFLLLCLQTFSALAGIILFFIHPEIRAVGWLSNANALGGYLLWGTLMITSLSLYRSSRWYWPALLVIFLGWVLTLSLTSFVAAAVPFSILLWWRRPKNTTGLARIRLMVALMLTISIIGFSVAALAQRGLLPAAHISSSFSQRQEFMRASWQMWRQKPWFGWGLGSFQVTLPRFTNQIQELPRYPHNLYAQMFVEAGLVGGLAWLLFVVIVGRLGWRAIQASSGPDRIFLEGLWLGWLAFTIHAGLDFSWQFPAGQVWWWAVSGIFIGRAGRSALTILSTNRINQLIALLLIAWLGWHSSMMLASQQAEAKGDIAAAGADQRRAVIAYKQSVSSNRNRENLLKLMKQYWLGHDPTELQQAEKQLTAVIAANQDDYALQSVLGRVYVTEKKPDKALPYFSAAYNLDPLFHPDYAADYAQLLAAHGDNNLALEVAEKTLRLYSGTVQATLPNFIPPLNRLQQLYDRLKTN